ncbi:hypothetical protein ACFX2I_006759 [Malus domestica]
MEDNDEGGGSETLLRLSPPNRLIARSRPVSWLPPTISRSFPFPIFRFYCLSKASCTTPPVPTPPQLPSFFTVSSQHSRSSRAYAIYPKTSFFNHDCLPNACRFDYIDIDSEHNTDMVIRMIHDVPAWRGICLSYFSVNQSHSNRHRTLARDYGFACQCDRCKVEASWFDNEEGEEEAKGMDEDQDQEMEASLESEPESGIDIEEAKAKAQEEADFPHAYFFVRFMCNRTNC